MPGEYRFLLIDSKFYDEFVLTCSSQNGNASLVALHSVKRKDFLSSYDIIACNNFLKRCNNLLTISLIGHYCKPGGLPYERDTYTSKILKRIAAKILLGGRGLKCFSPLEGANSKTTHYLLTYFLGSVPGKAPTTNLLGLNTLKGTKPRF